MPQFSIKEVSTDSELVRRQLLVMSRRTFGERVTVDFSDYFWMVFDDRDRPAGFASLNVPADRRFGFLSLCGVMQRARGQGIQRRLIRTRIRKGRTLGVTRFVTYTSCDNFKSANNLIGCGFKLYKPPFPYGVPNALYFLRLFPN